MSDLKYSKSLPDVDIWFETLARYTPYDAEDWVWSGTPYSRTDRGIMDDSYRLIDNSIALSPTEMCLISKYGYVRECKKWLIENKQDGVKLKDPYEELDLIYEELDLITEE